MPQKSNIEVVTLVFHLIVTLAVLAAYLYSIAVGHPDETLRNVLLLAAGYWYGALQMNKIRGINKQGDSTDATK